MRSRLSAGNVRHLTIGVQQKRHRLVLGRLPNTFGEAATWPLRYRSLLEGAVLTSHGEITLMHAHYIDAACTHEQHAAVCRWVMRARLDRMTGDELARCVGAMATAKDKRNRAVRRLQLDKPSRRNLRQAYVELLGEVSEQAEEHIARVESISPLSHAGKMSP